MDIFETCVTKLISLRKEFKLSQKQAGEIVGLSKQAVNDIEKGRNKISLEHLFLWANYYRVSLDYLVGRSDKREPRPDSLCPDEALELVEIFRNVDALSKGMIIGRVREIEENYKTRDIAKKLMNEKK
ncbi:MAG: helix-turn-helix transcriptional regulator [Eubacteriales bacterium]|nr:helix-turn-helix transcriptional regulator [Eubacteriales bacterium]